MCTPPHSVCCDQSPPDSEPGPLPKLFPKLRKSEPFKAFWALLMAYAIPQAVCRVLGLRWETCSPAALPHGKFSMPLSIRHPTQLAAAYSRPPVGAALAWHAALGSLSSKILQHAAHHHSPTGDTLNHSAPSRRTQAPRSNAHGQARRLRVVEGDILKADTPALIQQLLELSRATCR